MILAGDIGGTHTRLALLQAEREGLLQAVVENTFPSAEFGSLDEIVSRFTSAHRLPVERACTRCGLTASTGPTNWSGPVSGDGQAPDRDRPDSPIRA